MPIDMWGALALEVRPNGSPPPFHSSLFPHLEKILHICLFCLRFSLTHAHPIFAENGCHVTALIHPLVGSEKNNSCLMHS